MKLDYFGDAKVLGVSGPARDLWIEILLAVLSAPISLVGSRKGPVD